MSQILNHVASPQLITRDDLAGQKCYICRRQNYEIYSAEYVNFTWKTRKAEHRLPKFTIIETISRDRDQNFKTTAHRQKYANLNELAIWNIVAAISRKSTNASQSYEGSKTGISTRIPEQNGTSFAPGNPRNAAPKWPHRKPNQHSQCNRRRGQSPRSTHVQSDFRMRDPCNNITINAPKK